ncbi:MAG: flavodoxin family protein [Lachnospiraceae bacterium]|nr:flavodoxin family protein [Lachnospiraceae bacterium]
MKVLVLNASPRKTGNTAKLLKSAADGARDVGAEVEYINLYELIFTGCRGCMLCKRKGVERCHCYWKDDLSPIIDKIFHADVLLIGTAIYLGRPTSRYFELLERLHFCSLSYDDYSNYFKGKVNVGLFVSMNATKEFYDRLYKAKFEEYAKEWEMLGDKVILYPCYDTLQVSDYSKFNMASFDESKKKLSHEKNFPEDLENAYQIGQELSKRRLQLAGTSMDFRMLSPESPFKGSSKFPLP